MQLVVDRSDAWAGTTALDLCAFGALFAVGRGCLVSPAVSPAVFVDSGRLPQLAVKRKPDLMSCVPNGQDTGGRSTL